MSLSYVILLRHTLHKIFYRLLSDHAKFFVVVPCFSIVVLEHTVDSFTDVLFI